MSEWYNDLDYHDFDGKHVLVTLDDGTTISGAITYDTLALTPKKEDDTCSGYIRMNTTVPMITAAYTSQRYLAILVNMEDCRWRPLDGIKSVDLIWDEKEYEQIPVDQIKAFDYVVFNGHIFQVVQAMQPFVSIAVDSIVMYARLDKSMISTALRRKNGESS
ncbi:MAG: hypothetical protein [Caudoviricetes sp.]|nr:MAG: hypothetical protein [Caudoviricetes sp.]